MIEGEGIEPPSTALAVITPGALMHHATDVAGACKAIVAATAQTIQNKKYVRVEGWQAIAIAHHCVASATNVRRELTGYAATGEVRRMDTGAIIATAEGFVGDDEPMWAKRPEFARRAMAQTRAISRACRSAFSHVVILMQAGLETTPAEEMEAAIEVNPQPAPTPRQAVPPSAPPPPHAPADAGEMVVGQIAHVSVRKGSNAKGPWTRFGIKLDGDDGWIGTFDTKAGQYAEERQGEWVRITFKTDSQGRRDLLSIEPLPDPSVGVEEHEPGLV